MKVGVHRGSLSVRVGRLGIFWLWSEVYKGLSVEWGDHRQLLDWVYTPREWKERGW